MKILYLHGIGSGADSRTPRELRNDFPRDEIYAPELPVHPKDAYNYICCMNDDYDLVIGTSLGGFYALTAFPMTKKLLVNPALFADTDIEEGITGIDWLNDKKCNFAQDIFKTKENSIKGSHSRDKEIIVEAIMEYKLNKGSIPVVVTCRPEICNNDDYVKEVIKAFEIH